MTLAELYLKTIFSCIACDGEIAPEEIQMVREISQVEDLFQGLEVEEVINGWIADINEIGAAFLQRFLKEIDTVAMSDDEQLTLVTLAFKAIEADNVTEYAEIKFFKKIRKHLSISDEQILATHPDKEIFLLQDFNEPEDLAWDTTTYFDLINIEALGQDNQNED